MPRSEITIDLGALRAQRRPLREAAAPAEVWAVVKADAYGHGAADAARVRARGGRAGALRRDRGRGRRAADCLPEARILVMGPLGAGEDGPRARRGARGRRLAPRRCPEGLAST